MAKYLWLLVLLTTIAQANDNVELLNELLSLETGETVDVLAEASTSDKNSSVTRTEPPVKAPDANSAAPDRSPAKPVIQAAMIPFHMHETLSLDLSTDDPNRLFVKGDKIINVACPHGFCLIDQAHLAETGDLLLTLTKSAAKAPAFTFFVSTESGAELTILASGRHIMGQTIGFVAKDGQAKSALNFEKSAPYPEMVVALMNAWIQTHQGDSSTLPEGYHLHFVDKPNDPITTPHGFTVTPIAVLAGGTFSGVLYRLNNFEAKTLHLQHKSFYQYNMIAVALSKESLAQGEIGFVYALFQGERNETDR